MASKLYALFERGDGEDFYWYQIGAAFLTLEALSEYVAKSDCKLSTDSVLKQKGDKIRLQKREDFFMAELNEGEIPDIWVKGETQPV